MFKYKNILILFILLVTLSITACNNQDNDTDNNPDTITEKIYIKEATNDNTYYEDEFNFTDFHVVYEVNGKATSSTMLLPTMCENYPDTFTSGEYNLTIKYKDLTCEFNFTLIEQEKSSSGLLYILNSDDTYSVVGYNGTDKDVIIPSKYKNKEITTLASEAFMNQEIDRVILPDSLKTIENKCFYNSTIKQISFNDELETIGDDAFDECYNLRYVYLKSNITTIGEKAFNKTNKILIESEMYPTGYSQKMYDSNNTYLYFDIKAANLKTDNNILYYEESNLVTIIDFFGSSEEYTVTNFNKNINIGPYAFYNHEELTKVNFNDKVKKILHQAFTKSGLVEVTLPNSIIELGDYAFSYCVDLVNFVCNDGLKTIPTGCFSACSILESIYISNTIERIEGHAFQNCYLLSETFIPMSVTYIGDSAFYMNKSNTLYLEASEIPATWDTNFNPSKCKIYYNQERAN